MRTISTHVLDTSLGTPAGGIAVVLERDAERSVERIGAGTTDSDGRLRDFVLAGMTLGEGTYRLRFQVGEYFAKSGRATFYPEVVVTFRVGPADAHYHVPLLLSPFGYSTYRGS